MGVKLVERYRGECQTSRSPSLGKGLSIHCRLTAIKQERDSFTQLDLEEQVKKYVAELQSEMTELIDANPQTPKERHQVFLLKKQIVDMVLVDARIDENREIQIRFCTNFRAHGGDSICIS